MCESCRAKGGEEGRSGGKKDMGYNGRRIWGCDLADMGIALSK